MPPEQLISLSKIRLENAKKLLVTSQTLIDAGDYKSSANRSYYAIFNAMRACLALYSIDYKRHSGVISDFRLLLIKSGKLDVSLSDIITVLFEMRNQSDYNDFYVVSKVDVLTQLDNAKYFISKVELLLNEMWETGNI